MRGYRLIKQIKIQEFKTLHPTYGGEKKTDICCKFTDLTSRGVPARLRIFTTSWRPFNSSKTRSAGDESTKMHSSVSSTADARDTEEVFGLWLRLLLLSALGREGFDAVFVDVVRGMGDTCRDVSNRSSKT